MGELRYAGDHDEEPTIDFTTKATKSTKVKSTQIRNLRVLRALRGAQNKLIVTRHPHGDVSEMCQELRSPPT